MSVASSFFVLTMLAAADADEPAVADSYQTLIVAPIAKEAGAADLRTDELRQAPGAEGDAGKALENLPGVARPALAGGELVVWGATADETRVVLDGIDLPALYHLGGLRSTVQSGFVRSIALVPGGYGAAFGRGLGGLVRIASRDVPAERYAGELDVDMLGAAFQAGTGFANGGGLLAAGGVGYLDRLLGNSLSSDERRLFPVPRYHDLQAKLSLPLRAEEKVELLWLSSADASAVTSTSPSPSATASSDQERSFTRLGSRYLRFLGDGSGVSVTPFVGWDHAGRDQRVGLAVASEVVDATVLGLRADYVAPLSGAVLTLGFDGLVTWATVRRSGPATLPTREGDISVFGQPMAAGASADSWSTVIGSLAPYAALELARGAWRLVPSFRLDADTLSSNRSAPPNGVTPRVGTARLAWSPAPRLAVAHQSRPWLREDLAVGLYHQAPSTSDLSAVFGTPTLGPMHAVHAVLGAAADLGTGRTLSIEPTLFYRHLWNLVMRDPAASPPLAHALVQDGVGRAYGAQVLLRFRHPPRFSGWLAYTISRSERRHDGGSYRLLDQDQTHLLTAVENLSLHGFVVGLRFRLATGMPRTPVTGSYLDTTTGQYQPIFGAQNTVRLPLFYALDLRVERRFRWHGVELSPYLEVLNLTNHANVEELTYDEQFISRSTITGLPILALAGLSVRF